MLPGLRALALLLPLAGVQEDRGASDEVVAGPIAARIDAFLTRLAGFDYGGSILIEKKGELLLRKAFGYADRTSGRAYTPGTIFDIGSLAKQFTAAAVLELERREALALDDPLELYFPEAPADKRAITLEQLLTHRAGLASDFPVQDPATPDYDDVDEATAVARILAQPLESRPGSSWSYSNCGFVLLASIVQRVSERDFRDFVRETVFAPAGMHHTGFWGSAPPPDEPVAFGQDGFGNVLHDPAHMRPTWFDLGGGEVWSTLDDLRAWVHALERTTVLDVERVTRLFEPRTAEVSSRDGAYAYGWFVQSTPRGTRQIHHGGDYLGTGAWLRWYPEDEILVITSTNVRHDLYPTQNVVQRVLPKMLFEDGAAPEVPAFARLDAPPPPGLEGAYALESGGRLVLRRIHGRLYLGAEGQDATDVLTGPSSVAEQRARCSQAALAAFEGVLRGEISALAPVLGQDPNPAFAGLLQKELEGLVDARGGLRKLTLLGTFATGYPHGNPQTTETTLLRLECARSDVIEAIRWTGSGREIAWTEVVNMPLASCVPLQLGADGAFVGWKLLEARALRLRQVTLEGAPGIELEVADGLVRAAALSYRSESGVPGGMGPLSAPRCITPCPRAWG